MNELEQIEIRKNKFWFKASLVFTLFIIICIVGFVKIGSAVGFYPSVDSTMVAYYHFNNNSAIGENQTFIVDSSTKSNNLSVITGTVQNITGGFLRDGAREFLNNASTIREGISTSTTNISGSVSLSFWFYTNNVSYQQGLVGRGVSSTRWAYGCYYLTNTVKCQIDNSSLTNFAVTTPSNTITNNTWYWVAFVYDVSTSTYVLYLNGNQNATGTINGNINANSGPLSIARWGDFNNHFLNGSIDEIIVWNRSISSQEVRDIYNNYVSDGKCTNQNFSVGCIIDKSFTFLGQNNINLNGSGINTTGVTDDFKSAIVIANSNLVIDLNGTTIFGNWANTILGTGNGSRSLFFINASFGNITFRNGVVKFYKKGITQSTTAGESIKIINMTFFACDMGAHLYRSNGYFTNNTFNQSWDDSLHIEGASADHNIIEYNNFIGGADGVSLSSTGDNSENNTVRFNNFLRKYTKYGIILSRSNNNIIENNYFNAFSDGIGLPGLNSNNIIRHNIFINSSENGTNWDDCPTCHGIHQYNEIGADDNLTIYNNSFYLMKTSIVAVNLSNSNISNNLFNYSATQHLYMSNKDNSTVSGNLFMNHGLVSFGGGEEFLSTESPIIYYILYNTFINSDEPYRLTGQGMTTNIFHTYTSNALQITNTGALNQNASLFVLTNALIYFSNGSVACSDISTCNGNINITLSPNNYSYVFDNANLTEGVTRTNFPIILSSSSYSSKTYTSTIDTVSNLPTTFIVQSCDTIGKISTSTQTWNTGDYSCNDYQVTLTNVIYQTGTTTFTLLYNQASQDTCINFASASDSFFSFVMVFIIVGVLGFLVYLLGFSDQETDLSTIGIMILIAFIIMLFGYSIISNIGSC